MATTLVNGHVLIRDKGAKVVLRPGEQAVKGKNSEGVVVREVDVAPCIAWKQGYFLFENERLEDILNELARWYDVNVFLKIRRYGRNVSPWICLDMKVLKRFLT